MSVGVSILSSGMVTAVGLSSAATCAALRADVDGFQETQFVAPGGAWVQGAPVRLPRNWIGEKRLAHLAAGAIVDALEGHRDKTGDLQLVLCLAEEDRPGRPVRDAQRFRDRVLEFAGLPKTTTAHVVEHGRPSGFVALERARRTFQRGEARHVLIVGADSLLSGPTIAHYLGDNRLITEHHANGFMPGEAAAAILCAGGKARHFAMVGLGLAREEAALYNTEELPLRGDGMSQAHRDALAQAGVLGADVTCKITDVSGESYFFKQSALAQQRTVRMREEIQEMWLPAECLGNIGAAFVPLMIGWGLNAYEKDYGPGAPVIVEGAADDGACGAAIFIGAERRKVAA